jgi:hypothetical protein
MLLRPLQCLFCCLHRLGNGTLFDSYRGRDSPAQFMLHMAQVRHVMRPEVMFHIREQARCLIAGRLDLLAVELRKSLHHARLLGSRISSLGCLFQQNIVAHSLHPHPVLVRTARMGAKVH